MIWAHTLLTKSTVKYRLVSNENKGKSLDPTVCYFSHVTRGEAFTWRMSIPIMQDVTYYTQTISEFFFLFFSMCFIHVSLIGNEKMAKKLSPNGRERKKKFSFIFNSSFLVKKNTVMIAFFFIIVWRVSPRERVPLP